MFDAQINAAIPQSIRLFVFCNRQMLSLHCSKLFHFVAPGCIIVNTTFGIVFKISDTFKQTLHIFFQYHLYQCQYYIDYRYLFTYLTFVVQIVELLQKLIVGPLLSNGLLILLITKVRRNISYQL